MRIQEFRKFKIFFPVEVKEEVKSQPLVEEEAEKEIDLDEGEGEG